jgi:2-octaprenyl-6-methoxyphenol hydroxylase
MDKVDVIIAGGGLNGLTQALALCRAGFDVALADSEAEPERLGDVRSYALNQASINLMTALGVWPEVAPHAQEMSEVCISDGLIGSGPSPLALEFGASDNAGMTPGFMVEQRHLRPALLKALHASDVRLAFGIRIDAAEVRPAKVEVAFGDQPLAAALVIGADGKASGLAAQAGIKRTGWSYGQHAIVMTLTHTVPHTGRTHQFFTPTGPLALLPLQDNRTCVVWTESSDQATALTALPEEQFLAAFRPLVGEVLGEITLEAGPATFPLQLSLADSFVGPRLALIGDAAHVVHPLAGQGLNAGLKDVAALTEVLTKAARRGEDIGRPDVLARYEQWRRFDVAQLAFMTDSVNRMFSNDNLLLRAGRDVALAAIGRISGFKRLIAREASGQWGDLPELLKS